MEAIQAALQGKNQFDFWKRFGLLFRVKSVQFLEEVQAAIRGEINLVFGIDRSAVRDEINPFFGGDSCCCSG